MVTFNEDDNIVEMEVDSSEFPSEGEEEIETVTTPVHEDSSSEEGEISFNNNATTDGRLKSKVVKVDKGRSSEGGSGTVVDKGTVEEESEEDRENGIISKTVARLQEIMAAGGYMNNNAVKAISENSRDKAKEQTKRKTGRDLESSTNNHEGKLVDGSASESTIYKVVVQAEQEKNVVPDVERRVSSSSDEDNAINVSEETVDLNNDAQIMEFLKHARNNFDNENTIVETRRDEQRQSRILDPARPSTSRPQSHEVQFQRINNSNEGKEKPTRLEDEVTRLIREAEASKARILDPSRGREIETSMNNISHNNFMRTAIMDEDYLIVAAHIDEGLERRIRSGDFVDFARLIPRDRVQMLQDHRMELVQQNVFLTCAPVSESNNSNSINSFARWEQAFRVFSNIYTREYPQRAAELIQYNHVIHTAAMTYSWSNVYAYDIDFRLHMSRHPQRSWNVILQQAWNLRLKDRNDVDRRSSGYQRRRYICWRYNKGKCTYGDRCKFDHRCGICGKHGHGAHICKRGAGNDWDDHHKKRDKYDRHDRRNDHGKDGRGGHNYHNGSQGRAAVNA